MSLGGGDLTTPHNAVTYAPNGTGALPVAAAGNDGDATPATGRLLEVVPVAATDNRTRARRSPTPTPTSRWRRRRQRPVELQLERHSYTTLRHADGDPTPGVAAIIFAEPAQTPRRARTKPISVDDLAPPARHVLRVGRQPGQGRFVAPGPARRRHRWRRRVANCARGGVACPSRWAGVTERRLPSSTV
jgi:hypothetical protein